MLNRQERLVRAMAPAGGLFLLATLPELRRQGLNHLALYVLERTVQESKPWRGEGFPVSALRSETGLSDYEISKACTLLKKGDLVTISRVAGDKRERTLMRTARGIDVLDKILSAAATRLWKGLPPWARGRRVSETTQILRKANDRLLGPIQLTIFDKNTPTKAKKPPRKSKQPTGMQNARNEKTRTPKGTRTPKHESLMEQIYG